ncbi:hypothetical protein DWW36_08230 [Erysipelotrichaceae bacterium AF15-26LB]|nr:hypothetical protein DWW36_08230 [Erysipelotrichaceae bacterium AF15-26LB]RJV91258.1 hypothetical protein DWX45_06145 [Erysipelotrichaceae bacterium AF19-24AC]
MHCKSQSSLQKAADMNASFQSAIPGAIPIGEACERGLFYRKKKAGKQRLYKRYACMLDI